MKICKYTDVGIAHNNIIIIIGNKVVHDDSQSASTKKAQFIKLRMTYCTLGQHKHKTLKCHMTNIWKNYHNDVNNQILETSKGESNAQKTATITTSSLFRLGQISNLCPDPTNNPKLWPRDNVKYIIRNEQSFRRTSGTYT